MSIFYIKAVIGSNLDESDIHLTRNVCSFSFMRSDVALCPSSLPYWWQPALGAAGGEEGGEADRGGRQPEPRVPAHPRPARVPLRLVQGRSGRWQSRHQGEQGETHTSNRVSWMLTWHFLRLRCWHEAVFGLWFHLTCCWPDSCSLSLSSILLSLPGWRSPGSGWNWCVEDRGRVPAALVQRHQQHSYARLRLSTHLG